MYDQETPDHAPHASVEVPRLLFFHHVPCACLIELANDSGDVATWKRYRLFRDGGDLKLELLSPTPAEASEVQHGS